jgi:hypothetical protein
MSLARALKGFKYAVNTDLPMSSGVYLISRTEDGIEKPLYAEYSDNIAESIKAAFAKLEFKGGGISGFQYQIYPTTNNKKGTAMAQELSLHCKHK